MTTILLALATSMANAQSSSATLPEVVPATNTAPVPFATDLPAAGTTADQTNKTASKYDTEHPYNKDFQSIDKLLNNKEFKDDEKLTDLRLRAASGSLSKYSISGTMLYLGPILADPTAPDRPNPDHKIGNYAQQLQGNVSARYRLSSDDSLGFGSGVSFSHPLTGVDQTDASNPFVNFTHASRLGKAQNLSSAEAAYTTVSQNVATGQIGALKIRNATVYGIGRSRFSVSADFSLSYFLYSRGYIPATTGGGGVGGAIIAGADGTFIGDAGGKPGAAKKKFAGTGSVITGGSMGDGNATQYQFDVTPGIKYAISDKFETYGNTRFGYADPRAAQSQTVLTNNTVTAQVGLGYSYNRDIYFGPNVQSQVSSISSDTTTVNFVAVFSLL